MRDPSPKPSSTVALFNLALRLSPLLEAGEATRVTLEACAGLAGADAGLLLADELPPAAYGVPMPDPAEVAAIAATPAVRATSQLIGVGALPPGVVPLPGPAPIAAAIPGAQGPQGVLLLARAGSRRFERSARTELTTALPLVGQTLERARRFARLHRADYLRDGVVARLAHDIRSPLVATHAAIEVAQRLLRDREVPPAVFEALQAGLRSVQTAVELCDDMLEVARLQQGFRIVPQPVSVAELISEICQVLQPIALQRGIVLTNQGAYPALQVAGDERLLQRMLTNLVSNGLRFAPAGGFVAVEGVPGDEPGTILLRVSDNGPGIPPAAREQIFLPFVQGGGEAQRGVGLGLALCREVVEAHRGRIWVTERPGGGCVFVVRLPAAGGATGDEGHR
ncbi:MAG: HAMP domain-containing histidine kinase [Chloroflexi bacterium]|nr:HAMP domain-containing histidine kinase [Chloroflexota bacterium]